MSARGAEQPRPVHLGDDRGPDHRRRRPPLSGPLNLHASNADTIDAADSGLHEAGANHRESVFLISAAYDARATSFATIYYGSTLVATSIQGELYLDLRSEFRSISGRSQFSWNGQNGSTFTFRTSSIGRRANSTPTARRNP